MTVTFVTCYYRLYANDLKPDSWRIAHFESIAALGVNICVYGDDKTTPLLQEMVVKYPNIRLLQLDIPYTQGSIVKACHARPWKLPDGRDPKKDTLEYMTLMNAKIEFVHDALLKNPFQTDCFAWMDFSMAYLFQCKEETFFQSKEESLAKLQKISERQWPRSFLAMAGCWPPLAPSSDIANHIHWRFCGTFFMGDRASLQQFYKLYQDHFPGFLYRGDCLTWEVNFWAWLEANVAEWKPQWYEARHDDRLMNLLYEYKNEPRLSCIVDFPMNFEQLHNKYQTEYTQRLLKNKHIFYEIYEVCGYRFKAGVGSYLFDGQSYCYCDAMYLKQELLYTSVKSATRVLEIGTYMGHSLLIMLLSNPQLQITCIDISDEFTKPAVQVLNKYFPGAIQFLHNESLKILPTLHNENETFDFFHVDGYHENDYIKTEFSWITKMNKGSTLRIVFDDLIYIGHLQKEIHDKYKVLHQTVPDCLWNNIYLEIQLNQSSHIAPFRIEEAAAPSSLNEKKCTLDLDFNEKSSTPLCEIMGRNKSDKGQENILLAKHNYTTCYHHLFKNIRYESLRIFELGIGTNNINLPSSMGPNGRPGASLYGWAEYFPHSPIFGADIDRDILFQTHRIQTFYCDQTDPIVIQQMWQQPELLENFDILIEDGLHASQANICFLENSLYKIKPAGYYIIEDIIENEINIFERKLEEWKKKYPEFEFCLLTIPNPNNTYDNTLLIAHRRPV